MSFSLGRHLRRASFLGLLCLLGCDGQRGAHSHPSERDWVLVTTEHFRVYSDLDGEEVRALATNLEQDLVLIGQAAFQSPAAVVEPTDVVVFSRRGHFQRYFPKSIGGIAYPRLPLLPESHHTVVTFEQLGTTMNTTLRHELVHDMYARNFGAAPPWLNEGVAQYFSTVELVGGQIHIGVPLPDTALTKRPYPFTVVDKGTVIQAIPRTMIPAASALLAMSAEDFYGPTKAPSDEEGTAPEALANYFGAWALVHYLMGQNGESSHRFQTFLKVVTTTSVSAAWDEAFAGVDMQEFDEEFRSFLAAGQFALLGVPYRPPARTPSPMVRALSEGEKHVLLAKLALGRARFGQTASVFSEELDAAIHAKPPPAEAYYLRGMYAQSLDKDVEAERDFVTALRLAPDDPHILRASLVLRFDRHHGELTAQERPQFHAEIAKLERLASSPGDLLFVAHFYATLGEVPRALTIGARAVSRSPVDPLVLNMYARLLASCDHLEQAIATQRRAIDFLNEDQALRQRLQRDLQRMLAQLAQPNQHTPSALPATER